MTHFTNTNEIFYTNFKLKIKKNHILIFLLFLFGLPSSGQMVPGFNYQAVIRDNDGKLQTNSDIELMAFIVTEEKTVFEAIYSIQSDDFGTINLVIGEGSQEFMDIDWSVGNHYLNIHVDTGNGFIETGNMMIYPVPYANLAKDVINKDDADADPFNELQSLQLSGDKLSITGGNTLSLAPFITPWTANGTDLYRLEGNVGIGTETPHAQLAVGGQGADNISIYGQSGASLGTGIAGFATTAEGISYGGRFNASSTRGRAVYAFATALEGENFGGYFKTSSDSGCAIFGQASETSGNNYGGKFEAKGRFGFGLHVTTEGEHGTGIYAENTSESGPTYGGHFRTHSESGIAVQGLAMSETGMNYGGAFVADGEDGIGVYGEASSTEFGIKYGGKFLANGFNGVGVRGEAEEGIGVSGFGGHKGIQGYSTNTGVYGYGGGNVFFSDEDVYGGRFVATTSGGDGNCYGIEVWGDDIGITSFGNDFDYYAENKNSVDYGGPSSIRWKENIEVINNPLEKLKQIRGVYFDWKEEHGGKHSMGCIAEEVGKVLPEIVVYEDNGIDAIGMDYSKLTPLLIESIKAQQKQIDELKSVISTLEKQINESRLNN